MDKEIRAHVAARKQITRLNLDGGSGDASPVSQDVLDEVVTISD